MSNAIQIIRDADRGQVLQDLQRGLDEIVQAIEADRGQGVGEITLKLKIKSKSEGAYTIIPSLTIKVPQPARLETLAFLDNEGELQRYDPRQPVLPSVVEADFRNNQGGAGARTQTQE